MAYDTKRGSSHGEPGEDFVDVDDDAVADAEGGEAHPSDGCDDVFAVGVQLAGLDVGEVGVEAGALVGGHPAAGAATRRNSTLYCRIS